MATAALTEAIAIRESIGYRRGAALSRLVLGLVDMKADRTDQAIHQLARARAELAGENDRFDAARAQAWLGRTWACRGDYTKATTLLHQALGEFEATGARPWQARVLEMLGETAHDQGDTTTARHFYQQALTGYQHISPHDTKRVRSLLRDLA